MEAKSGSRSLKKSNSSGVLADRNKKSKSKKKKERRKASVKGTESTDIPSPELDSEVPLDGDALLTDQDGGRTSPVTGQVTRLPQLSSHSSVSLTTQTPPPVPLPRKSTLAAPSSSSAPTLRPSAPLLTPTNNVEGVVARVASLNIKQRATKTRTKTQTAKFKSTRARDRPGGTNVTSNTSKSLTQTGGASDPLTNESLRWEKVLEDVEQERERIAVYKMNRRKRYLAAAQAKGLGWAMNYNTQSNASPLSEDSGVDTLYSSPGTTTTPTATGAYIDFSTVQALRSIPAHSRGLQEAFVEC